MLGIKWAGFHKGITSCAFSLLRERAGAVRSIGGAAREVWGDGGTLAVAATEALCYASKAELSVIHRGLKAAREGRFATDEQVEELFKKHRPT
jgi:hypothetical protein